MYHVACHVSHKDMLQRSFRQDNSTCLASSPVNKSLRILSVAVCLVNLLLARSCNCNKQNVLNSEHIRNSFLIERYKCGYHETF